MLLDFGLLVLAFYFLQEGMAQHGAAPSVKFYVDFPDWLTYLAGAATVLLMPNFAINALVLRRNLQPRRWVWLTTAIAIALLATVTIVIGPRDVLTIINPNW